jgi:DNA-binding response OmpR family regulator
MGTKTVVPPPTVLVVDDESVILQLLTDLFNSRGIPVVIADTGEKALETLKTTGVGCLLIDKNLPGIDGLDVIRTARELQPYCACIVMTAYSSTESAVEALRLGAMDYIEKPFADLDLVARKVELATDNQRAQFERNELLERIRAYDAQLNEKDLEVGRRRSEVEMFEMVLDARIREATDDLRRKAKIFEANVKSGDHRMTAVIEGINELSRTVRNLGLDDDVTRQLVEQIEELRKTAQS